MKPRTIKALHPAERDDIGDLVTRRPLPGPRLPQLDPFLFLNHHGPQTYAPGNSGLPFGPHPHRGFETVTFILEGELAHRDTGGHESIIKAGGVQWMTAGRGVVHAELSPESFKRAGGPLEILQLWVNLPSRLKMTPPRYMGLQGSDLPSFAVENGSVLIDPVSGPWFGRDGPAASITGTALAVLRFPSAGKLDVPVAPGRSIFLYVVRGTLSVAGHSVKQFTLVEMAEDGDALALSGSAGTLVLLGHGEPIGEPVAAWGPFVMNTRAEIEQAVADYRAGKFGAI